MCSVPRRWGWGKSPGGVWVCTIEPPEVGTSPTAQHVLLLISADTLVCLRMPPGDGRTAPLLLVGPELYCAGFQLGAPTSGVKSCARLVGSVRAVWNFYSREFVRKMVRLKLSMIQPSTHLLGFHTSLPFLSFFRKFGS